MVLLNWLNRQLDKFVKLVLPRYIGLPEKEGILHIYMQAKGAHKHEVDVKWKGAERPRVRAGCVIEEKMLYKSNNLPEGYYYNKACDKIIDKLGDILWLE